MTIVHMQDLSLTNQRVLIREDFNVPMTEGQIANDQRLRAALPTLKYALKQQARVLVMSHLGRPNEGEYEEKYSLAPVAKRLGDLLGVPVKFIGDWSEGTSVKPGEIALLENVRFLAGENANDDKLAKRMAALCDIFVMDAFATAHRSQASTVGVAEYAPVACAGPLLAAELSALNQAIHNPKPPLLAIVGGAKVSSKLELLATMVEKVQILIVGGGIANTFLAATGQPVGRSLYEPDLLPQAKAILESAKRHQCQMPLPKDVVVATAFAKDALATEKAVSEVQENEMILDIGSKTTQEYVELINKANTVIWNGPVGVCEWLPFAQGTEMLAQAIAKNKGFKMAGGGDTIAAIDQFQIADRMSYISTGGGAFLEYLEGKTLPAVAELIKRSKEPIKT